MPAEARPPGVTKEEGNGRELQRVLRIKGPGGFGCRPRGSPAKEKHPHDEVPDRLQPAAFRAVAPAAADRMDLGVRKVLASAGQGTPERPASTAIHLAPSERPAPSPDEKARLCDRPGRRDGGVQSHPFLVYALVQLV